jgi:hypothetical protein
MDENIESQDSSNLDGGADSQTYTQEQVDAMIEAKTSKLYARAKVAETKLKERSTEAKPVIKSAEPQEDIWEVAEYIREGYSREEVDFLRANGGKEALKDPNSLVSLALKAKQEQKRAELAASQATGTSEYADASLRQYSQADLAKMSAADLAKILPHAD